MHSLISSRPIQVIIESAGTPLWLTFVTLTVSVGAVLISLWQAVANNFDRRLSRPHIEASGGFSENYMYKAGNGTKAVLIHLRNLGREATMVQGFLIEADNILLNGPSNSSRRTTSSL